MRARSAFMRARRCLASKRRRCALRVGWVATLGREMMVAAQTNARNRMMAEPVLVQAAVALCLDHHDALDADALVGGMPQARLDGLRQRRGLYVEAQVNRVGDLVDVPAAGTLGANRDESDLLLT